MGCPCSCTVVGSHLPCHPAHVHTPTLTPPTPMPTYLTHVVHSCTEFKQAGQVTSSNQFCTTKTSTSSTKPNPPPEPTKDSTSTPPIHRLDRFRRPIHRTITNVQSPLRFHDHDHSGSPQASLLLPPLVLDPLYTEPPSYSHLALYHASGLTRASSATAYNVQRPRSKASFLGPPLRFSIPPPTTVHHDPLDSNRTTSQHGRFKPGWITLD